MELSKIINELGEDRELYFNAIAPPIMQTSNFAFRKVADLGKAFEDEMKGYLYSRGVNPTIDILRKNWQHWMERKTVSFSIMALQQYLPASLPI
jgi:O-acetylhomoserine/O-acetylserine sulfhydrylase-like pyridoxal-dependent enzyme